MSAAQILVVIIGRTMLRIAPYRWKVRVLDDLLRCHSREDTIGGAYGVPGCHLSGRYSFVKAEQCRIRATYAKEVASEDAPLVLGGRLGL